MHYMEESEPLGAVKRNIACISVRWSTFNDMDYSVGGGEPYDRVVKIGVWYELDGSSSLWVVRIV